MIFAKVLSQWRQRKTCCEGQTELCLVSIVLAYRLTASLFVKCVLFVRLECSAAGALAVCDAASDRHLV